jgi:hypothetical protein
MGGLEPPIQGNKRRHMYLWMARIRWRYAPEAGHGEMGIKKAPDCSGAFCF